MKFSEYYDKKINTPRNIVDKIPYNKTFNWREDHRSITDHDSVCVGILNETYSIWEREKYIDCHVIPVLTECIRQALSKNKSICCVLNNIADENYVTNILNIKFPNQIKYIQRNKDLIEHIKEIEKDRDIAITVVNENDSFTLKYIIENI